MIALNINNKILEFGDGKIEIGRNKNIEKDVEIINSKESINIFFKKIKSISRKHCEIFKENSQWFILDKKSTNGTFINGEQIKESFPLKNGDKISLGNETIISVKLKDDDATCLEDIENIDFGEETTFDEEGTNFINRKEIKNPEKTQLLIEEEYEEVEIELRADTLLNRSQYRILKTLKSTNNTTITYLAKDTHLNINVVIKEYFPRAIAHRDKDNQVIPTNPLFYNEYEEFKHRATTLAKLPTHQNVIEIKNFFKENLTLYYVMNYIKGYTLQDFLLKNYPLNQKSMEKIIFPLLEGVKHLHKHNILHKEITLENILLTPHGIPIIIDLTSLEHDNRDSVEAYKAIEIHAKEKIGQYTDIYALGGVLYSLINGITNPRELPSTRERLNRLNREGDAPLSFTHKNKISKRFINATQEALNIRPVDRPQNVEELLSLLKKPKGLLSWLF